MMVKEKDVNLYDVDDLYDNDVDDLYDNDIDDLYDKDDDVDDLYDNDDDVMVFMIMMMMLMIFMIMMMMLMIFMIMMMITKIIMITIRSKRKKGGVGEGSFLTDLSISNRKQLKLDQRTAHICRFLVKVTRISVSRCTRLK